MLANDTDVEGDSLTVVEVNGLAANVGIPVTLASGAIVTLNADGSFTYDPNGSFEALDTGETDTDSFTYRANDGDLESNAATVTITINGVNDAPVAVDDTGSTDEDTALVVAAPGVLTNDTDVEGDSLTVVKVNGLAANVGTPVTLASARSSRSTPTARSRYDPNGSFESLDTGETDTDSFTYRASDGDLESNAATVTITINGVNDAPVCEDVTLTTSEDTVGTTAPDCTDVEGDTLTYAIVAQPTNGSAAVNLDGHLEYTPNLNFNGSDSFTYKANDGTVDSNTANVAVTVTEVNDAPVAGTLTLTPDSIDENGSTTRDADVHRRRYGPDAHLHIRLG